MWEFIVNIWNEIVSNWEPIVTGLSVSSVAAIVTDIVLTCKQRKAITNNTMSNTNTATELNAVTASNDELKSEIRENTASNNALKKELVEDITLIKAENIELKNQLSDVISKIGSILEVMGLVYSTIRDEKIRTTVANIITNAKYNETATRAALEQQLEELKNKVVKDAELLKAEVNETVNQVETVINPTAKQVKTNTRY